MLFKRKALWVICAAVFAGGGALYAAKDRAAGGSTAEGGGEEKPLAGPLGATRPPVGFIVTAATAVPVEFDFVGTTEASHRVEIRSRIRGFLEGRHFEEGRLVRKGDLLYSIDAAPFEADLRIARANLAQKQARLELEERETERLRTLVEDEIISASEFDRQEAVRNEARAAVQLAQAEVDKAELELGYTRIRAPFTGLIEASNREVGSLVDDSANSLLTELLRVDPLEVHFSISENQYRATESDVKAGRLKPTGEGEPHIELTLVDGQTYPLSGTINFLNPAIDRATGTVGYRAQVANAEGELKPGQFVQVKLKGLERPGTITVPQEAVSQSPKGPFVYVIGEGDMVQTRDVKLAEWSGADWIVTAGLESGERVVTQGLGRLKPGLEVTAEPASGAGPDVASGGTRP